jgi:predicted dehydrogenase
MLETGVEADAVIIALQDAEHAPCAIACAEAGYAILCEKPLAPTAAACRAMVEAAQTNDVLFAVCHVLRYTPYITVLKSLLDSGRVGEIMSLDQLEPVGNLHYAHSYVRGNWRREDQSSSMLLAKSCHDLDVIRYLMQRTCLEVSSFGSLTYFTADHQPVGAAERCLDCRIEPACIYSAKKAYLDAAARGETGWPIDVLAAEPSPANVLAALRDGPYGRCVWACDNDVVDHQVVNMRFSGDRTATFTMTAFSEQRARETRIFGTLGEIFGDGNEIRIRDFRTGRTEIIPIDTANDGLMASGHGGGDEGVMKAFLAAVAANDPSLLLSGPEEALESHLMVFAAEEARRKGAVVSVHSADGAIARAEAATGRPPS